MAGSRQPISLVQAKGRKHLTKSEIEERKETEVKGNSDNIEAPSYLPDNLKLKFDLIAEELIDIGIMTNLDCEVLARYVVLEYQFQEVFKKLSTLNMDDDEYDKILNRQDKIFKQVRQVGNDLGLSISSRCKLVIPKKKEEEKPKDMADQLFGGIL